MKSALAALVLLLGGCSSASDAGGSDAAPTSAPSSTSSVLRLTAPSGSSGRCMMPTSAALAARADLALDGTVTALTGERATLTVSRWYAGAGPAEVEVTAPRADLQALVQAVRLTEGGRYLLAADADRTLMVCGFSAPWSQETEAMYRDAFPRG